MSSVFIKQAPSVDLNMQSQSLVATPSIQLMSKCEGGSGGPAPLRLQPQDKLPTCETAIFITGPLTVACVLSRREMSRSLTTSVFCQSACWSVQPVTHSSSRL